MYVLKKTRLDGSLQAMYVLKKTRLDGKSTSYVCVKENPVRRFVKKDAVCKDP